MSSVNNKLQNIGGATLSVNCRAREMLKGNCANLFQLTGLSIKGDAGDLSTACHPKPAIPASECPPRQCEKLIAASGAADGFSLFNSPDFRKTLYICDAGA